ncbi:MAG: 50S ribosomal protein L13 [Candidatus Levybacteria bacterium RBG_16_35_6]|nr:MAG: 50S ribosomal protein L13 [Candidatus Levybacteria bacterium RBG_16_35_6]
MKSSTKTTEKEIKREWHLIDLKGQTLGRVSTQIAKFLMGKSKNNFVRHLDMGDYVVIINAKEVKVTGKKEDNKKYYRHSGFPGGFRTETLKELRAKRPEEIIKHAVSGMLPQNRLRAKMLKRLKVFSGETHTFADKFKAKVDKE